MNWINFFKSFGEGVQAGMQKAEARVEHMARKVEYKIERIKRKIFASMLQLLFVAIGVVALIIGAVLFFARFFAYDVIFLVTGIILLYVAMLVGWKR